MKNKLNKFFTVIILLLFVGVGDVWGWTIDNGKTIYFDMQNCTGFGTPNIRIGRDNYSASSVMTLVPGTKYLYKYDQTGGNWSDMGAFSVADNCGWTGDNKTIYQPYNDNGTSKPDDSYKITKQTDFQKYNVSSDCYLKITDTGNSENNCQYYHVNDVTSGDGSLAALPTYSITYTASPSNGTVAVYKYDGTDYDESLSSGTTGLKPTQIIKITTTPSTHYVLDELTVTGATQIDAGDTYYITGNCEITATFAPKWSINGTMTDPAWDIYQGMEFVSEHTHRGKITLAAHTAYKFKVLDRSTNTWYGCGTRDHDYT